MEEIQAGQFKAHCLKVMERVSKTGREVVVTKRNVPFVVVCPFQKKKIPAFGRMRGTIQFKKNIIEPIEEKWDACS